MKMRIQVVVETDDGTMAVQEVAKIAREDLRPDTVGLRLDEAKDLLRSVQQVVVERQITDHLTRQDSCPCCDRPRLHKGAHTVVLRTLFGTLRLRSPRLYHCPCQPHPTRTFSPLADVLSERATPELVYLETKFAALVS